MAPPESRSAAAHQHGTAVAGRDGERIVVWLRGEHDIATVVDLSETLVRACAADADLVVDLSEVQFMDASTIGVIVRARNFLQSRPHSMTVRSPTTYARRLLDACNLGELIDADPQRSETAGALGSWVAVPVSDRADDRAGESVPAGAETSGEGERADDGATVLDAPRGP